MLYSFMIFFSGIIGFIFISFLLWFLYDLSHLLELIFWFIFLLFIFLSISLLFFLRVIWHRKSHLFSYTLSFLFLICNSLIFRNYLIFISLLNLNVDYEQYFLLVAFKSYRNYSFLIHILRKLLIIFQKRIFYLDLSLLLVKLYYL